MVPGDFLFCFETYSCFYFEYHILCTSRHMLAGKSRRPPSWWRQFAAGVPGANGEWSGHQFLPEGHCWSFSCSPLVWISTINSVFIPCHSVLYLGDLSALVSNCDYLLSVVFESAADCLRSGKHWPLPARILPVMKAFRGFRESRMSLTWNSENILIDRRNANRRNAMFFTLDLLNKDESFRVGVWH